MDRDAKSFEKWAEELFQTKNSQARQINVDNDMNSKYEANAVPCLLNKVAETNYKSDSGNVIIWGSTFKVQVKLLVDTGASISVISDEFYNSVLRPYISMECPSNGPESIQTANGANIPVIGFVSFFVDIGNKAYDCRASIIPGLAYRVVLGRDFLQKHAAVIDVSRQMVTFTSNNTVPFADGHSPPLLCSVVVASTNMIEPRSESIIPATLATPPMHAVVGLVEGSDHLTSRYRLLAANSIASPTNEGAVSFRVLNPSDQPVYLHKGFALGTFTELDHTDILHLISPEERIPPICTTSVSSINASNTLLSELKSIESPDLNTSQNSALASLLLSYSDIFATSSLDLGHTSIIEHEIDTDQARPIKQSPYRVSVAQREEIDNHISNMLQQGIIEPSSSPWSSPVVLVKKKDGSTRFCVDYRKLNAVTIKDSYPLPRIDDAIDALSGSMYFTTLDLQSGYHQVAMHPSSKSKTTFISHAGLYEYNVMSFGLTNAPPTFQRLMSRVLSGLEWKICLIYIDDIIVFSTDFDTHLHRLSKVFARLRDAHLKLKPSKCHFARHTVKFLGFVVSPQGVSPDPAKLSAVQEFPIPRKT